MTLTARELIDCLQAMTEAERRELMQILPLRKPRDDFIGPGADPPAPGPLRDEFERLLRQHDEATRPERDLPAH